MQNAYQMVIRIALRSPAMLIFSMVMAFRLSTKLSLIYLAAIPVLGVGLYFIMTRVHPIFERVFKTYDKLNNVTQENLHGIRVVKSFVREDHEIQKFSGISEDIYRDFSRAEKRLAFNMPLMQFCMYACLILVSWFGARMIVSQTLTTGQLMSLMTYAIQILSSLMMLSMVFVMITISRASCERIVEILDEESDIVSPADAVTEVTDGSIDFDHVSFSYSKREDKCCLEDVDLHIPAGMTVGILGGTGSAKSSLVQLIPRLYDATIGTVKVGGVDVRQYDVEKLREEVAMVLQKNVLFSGTIKENLRWGDPNATDEEMQRVCRLAHADEFIQTFPDGYDTYIEQGGSNVSGGQKQRVGIARALSSDPKILLSDEATSALDPETTQATLQLLKKINKELGLTIVMITHEMDVVKQICNRVVVMNKGVVVEEGDVLEVFRDPKNEVTQAMLGTALAARTIPASMVERVKKVLNTPGENGRKNHLIRLTFVGSSTTEPVLSRACSKFDLDFNILLGQVDEIQSESYGTLTIVMEGTTENFRQALNYIAERGVRVEELTNVI